MGDAENSPAEAALAAWTAVLDALETSIGTAESALQDPLGSLAGHNSAGVWPQKNWLAPALTPLPTEITARAIGLAARQKLVTERLEGARLDMARQLQAISLVPGIGGPPAAVYLDVLG